MPLERFHLPHEISPDSVPYIAVAIGRTSHGNTHTGIVHRDPIDGVLLLEHAFHFDLRNNALSSEYGCVVPNLPRERARSVAGLCRLIGQRNSDRKGDSEAGFPYALRHDPHSRFDTLSGTLLLGKHGKGLTCATFVLVVFSSFGVSLVDFAGWPWREEDALWHRSIVELLKRLCNDLEHIRVVESEIGIDCCRFRCEEVAGASTVDDLPASFAESEEAGREILAVLDAYLSSTMGNS